MARWLSCLHAPSPTAPRGTRPRASAQVSPARGRGAVRPPRACRALARRTALNAPPSATDADASASSSATVYVDSDAGDGDATSPPPRAATAADTPPADVAPPRVFASLLPAASVDVTIEPAPGNARRLFAVVDVAAPPFVVWGALTDYERLSDFIPGLAENRCLSRGPARATLLQVAEKPLALGLRFRARVVLDIQEHEEGLPASLVADLPASSSDALAGGVGTAGLFPSPRAGAPPPRGTRPRDITFALIEGDFAAFRGVWRIQEGGGADDDDGASGGGPRTRLAYSLYVRPQPWLPIHLIANRVSADIAANLGAVRDYTERQWKG